MATATRRCKVCGVEYPYCKTVVKSGVFRYQDVACCPEHGSIYLARVQASRDADSTNGNGSEKQQSDYDELFKSISADTIDEDGDDDEDETIED